MAIEKVQLVVLGGPMDGLAYDLDKPETTIGRLRDRDVRLAWDGAVSRKHARLIRKDEEYWLEDEGSSYGTFIGDSKSELRVRTQISLGTTFRLGPVTTLKLKKVIEDTAKIEGRFIRQLSWLVSELAEGLPASRDSLSPKKVARFREQMADIHNRLDAVSDARQLFAVLQDLSSAIEELGVEVVGLAPAGLPVNQCQPDEEEGLESLKSFFKSNLTEIIEELDEEPGEGGE
jgi:pSer/pThr/pTyr-binding forkhead associated (FHA) protein